ncbi:MAG: ABC transporter permease [Thermoanaerobaculia bacterium]
MKFFRLIWKNVFRKKTRTFLTMASIVMVLVLIVILTSLLNALSYDRNAGGNRIVVQHATGLANFMPLAYRQRIEQVPGIVAVAPEIWFGGIYKDDKPENFFGQLSTDPDVWPKIFDDYKIDPAQIKVWQEERNSFIAGQELVNRYHWKLGDHIQLRGTYISLPLDLVLRGVYSSIDETNIFFHNKYLENSFLGRSGQTGIFYVKANSPAAVTPATETINKMFENSSAPVKAMSEKEFQLQFVEMLGNVKMFIRFITIMVLFVVVLIVANTVAMSARERVTEIAVMRALGFLRRQVLAIVLLEAVVLALLGGILGVLVSVPLVRTIVEGLKHSPAAPFTYNFRVTGSTLLLAFIASVSIGILSGIFPAIRSSRIKVVDGLRQVV